MTDPTDAEIVALADATRTAEGSANGYILPISFARAVLAKWGTPAGAGEVVACGNCGGTGWMVRDPDIGTDQECFVCDGSGRYSESATPQPTQPQAGAVPLTPFIPAQRGRLFYNRPKNVGKGLALADWHRVVQFIESAHGIKGGQHGTE